MKQELINEFGVQGGRVTVIPFGINNAIPNSCLTSHQARQRLGVRPNEKTILFFGNITPYKGLEYLIDAFSQIQVRGHYRLIIAGRPVKCEGYWKLIQQRVRPGVEKGVVLLRPDFIPDEETEVYFKAADVLVLPYKHVYQSGVMFLGYSFGLPVLAADVGSLKDEIVEGKTGFVFRPEEPADLVIAIERYFTSELYTDLNNRRREIRAYASKRHSWDVVGQMTMSVYACLFRTAKPLTREVSSASLDVNTPS